METHKCLYWIILLLVLNQTGKSCTFACTIADYGQTYEIATVKEGALADLRYKLTEKNYNLEGPNFAIEIRLCDSGSVRIVCKCTWVSKYKSDCKKQNTDFICDVKDYEMIVAFLINRSYTSVIWKLYKPKSVPVVLKQVMLQVTGTVKSSPNVCGFIENNQTSSEHNVLTEGKGANFTYKLNLKISKTSKYSDFSVEINVCDTGALHLLCKCRWIPGLDPPCKRLRNDAICQADNSEMRLSFVAKKTYSEIVWLLFKQTSAPVVVKHTSIQVTYPAKVEELRVNGKEVNESHLVEENQEVIVSCFFTNGNAAVSIRMVDGQGNTLSSTKHGESPLKLFLGVLYCHNVWPTIRCEAGDAELSRSVTILVKCPPQLSYITTQVSDLRSVLDGGLTLAMKFYTSDIRKCLLTKMEQVITTIEMNCEVNGQAPKFTLTLRFVHKSWIRQGTYTVQVMSELGTSNITFQLLNNTDEQSHTADIGF